MDITHLDVTAENIEAVCEVIGPRDMSGEVAIGDCITYRSALEGGYRHVLMFHGTDRAAVCANGDSLWGDLTDGDTKIVLDEDGGTIDTATGRDLSWDPEEIEVNLSAAALDNVDGCDNPEARKAVETAVRDALEAAFPDAVVTVEWQVQAFDTQSDEIGVTFRDGVSDNCTASGADSWTRMFPIADVVYRASEQAICDGAWLDA